MKKSVILALTSLFMSNAVLAQEAEEASPFTIKPMVIVGIAGGGDEMGTLEFEGGSSTDVTAGGGVTFGGGFEIQANEKPFGATATINYHSDSAVASNADITMDRFEFTFLPYYQVNEQIQLSAGLSMHTGVEFEIDFQGTDTIEFDSASALVFEIRYVLESGDMALSGRYTSVDYEATKVNGRSVSGADTVDGSNLGLFFTWSFDQ